MNNFVDNMCPKTNISVIFFSAGAPNGSVKTTLSTFKVNGNQYYISRGERGFWTYTYLPSYLKYLFTRHDTNIRAFIGREYSMVSGGAQFEIGSVGSHLTVGLKKLGNNPAVINTHYTKYEKDSNNAFAFNVDADTYKCYVPLNQRATQQTICITNWGVPISGKLLGDTYAPFPDFVQVIEALRSVYVSGQPTPSIQFSGGTHTGPRGGKYVMSACGKKKRYQGGAKGRALTDEMVGMIDKYIVKPVIKKCIHGIQFISVSLLYDQDNVFESRNTNMIFIYDFGEEERQQMFYVDVDKMFAAFDAFSAEGTATPFATRCFQEVQKMAAHQIDVLLET